MCETYCCTYLSVLTIFDMLHEVIFEEVSEDDAKIIIHFMTTHVMVENILCTF